MRRLVEVFDSGVRQACKQDLRSDDPKIYGRPENFPVTVREILIAAGAGFLIPITGDIMRMPGLPKIPQAENIDVMGGKIRGIK